MRAGDKGQTWLGVLQPASPTQDWQSLLQAAWPGASSPTCPQRPVSVALAPWLLAKGGDSPCEWGCTWTLLPVPCWEGGSRVGDTPWPQGTSVPLLYWC